MLNREEDCLTEGNEESNIESNISELRDGPSEEEVKEVIKMKNGKAAGEDNIVAELLK